MESASNETEAPKQTEMSALMFFAVEDKKRFLNPLKRV